MGAVKNGVVKAAALLCLTVYLAACSPQVSNHGFVPPEEDLQQLVVGVDNRATVDDLVGAPSASGLLSGGDYYYVRSQFEARAFFRPQVVERRVLAISFDTNDTIANIEEFSLADGNIVPLTRRVTETTVVGKGFLSSILGTFGNVDPSQLFN